MHDSVINIHENTGSLRLTLLTEAGAALNEAVEIRLIFIGEPEPRLVRAVATQPILIPNLPASPLGACQVLVTSETSEPEQRFVNIAPNAITDVRIIFHGKTKPPPPPDPCYKVPDTLTETDLSSRLRSALTTSSSGASTDAVVWQDKGDEVVVHLSTLQIRIEQPAVFAAVDLESDQTGRHALIVRFVFGDGQDQAGLFATSDEVVHGNSFLATRWGPTFRDLIWSALTRVSRDHAAERGLAPLRLSVEKNGLTLAASTSIPLPQRVKQILDTPSTPGATKQR